MEHFEPRKRDINIPLDSIAKKGHFKEGDLPGTDSYDDGMDHTGKIVQPGSTSTESGANYMDDVGPSDKIQRAPDVTQETDPESRGLRVVEKEKLNDNMYSGEDPAAKWLRENDPDYKKAA